MATLADLKIVKRSVKNCSCNKAFIYLLPTKIDEKVTDYMKVLGTPAFDLKKTAILRIETPEISITGVKRLREIRLTLKKDKNQNLIQSFEEALIKYVENKK